jgi:hypothetical protein
MKTAIRYLRISTEKQSKHSISGQDMRTAEWCERNNVAIVDTFVDEVLRNLGIDFYVPENIKVHKISYGKFLITITIPDTVPVKKEGIEATKEIRDGWRIIQLEVQNEKQDKQ